MQQVRTVSGLRRLVALGVASILVLSACGGDDDSDNAGDGDNAAVADGSAEPDNAEEADAAESGGGSGGASGGTLVLGDETIALDSARCFLEEQDAAAGGGKILFVAQAYGTNAAGDELVLDVSRYDEDSQFAGDDIIVDIGDPFSDDAVSMGAGGEVGTVTVDGSNVSAGDLTFLDFDDATERNGSFEINC